MTFPLTALGGAAIGTLAWHSLREFKPGNFLNELWSREPERAASAEPQPLNQSSVAKPDVSQVLSTLSKQLRQRLSQAGVNVSPPIVLKADGGGGVVVDGDHPDRTEIEQLLDADPQLRTDFLALSAAATRQREQIPAGFGPSLGEFRLRMAAEGDSIVFE